MGDLRIYVACLASYNNGRLHGRWIDCDGKDSDDLQAEVNEILRSSPYPNVMVDCENCDGSGRIGETDRDEPCPECGGRGKIPSAEEFAIHDTEGFGHLVGEYTPLSDVALIAEALGGDHALGFRWLVQNFGMSVADAAEQAAEVIIWQGDEFDSKDRMLADYAAEFYEETGGLPSDLPDEIKHNIDWLGIAKDWELNSAIDFVEMDGERFIVANADAF